MNGTAVASFWKVIVRVKINVRIGDILAIVSPVGCSNEWDTPNLRKVAQNSISVFDFLWQEISCHEKQKMKAQS